MTHTPFPLGPCRLLPNPACVSGTVMGREPAPKKPSVNCTCQACHQIIDMQDDTWDPSHVSQEPRDLKWKGAGRDFKWRGWRAPVGWLTGKSRGSTWLAVLRHTVSTLWAVGSPERRAPSSHPQTADGLEGGWLGAQGHSEASSPAGGLPRDWAGKMRMEER